MKHTPTPWNHKIAGLNHWICPTGGEESGHVAFIGGRDFLYKDISQDLQEANAEFIVRACNNHDQLVDTLKLIDAVGNGDVRMEATVLYDKIQEALAAIES